MGKHLNLVDTPEVAQAQRLAEYYTGERSSADFDVEKQDPDVFMGKAFLHVLHIAVTLADKLDATPSEEK